MFDKPLELKLVLNGTIIGKHFIQFQTETVYYKHHVIQVGPAFSNF